MLQAVLRGASHLFETKAVDYVMIEMSVFLLGQFGDSPSGVLEFMDSHGYKCSYVPYMRTMCGTMGCAVDVKNIGEAGYNNACYSFEEWNRILKDNKAWSDVICFNPELEI